ncbi:hypothetical protein WJ0W_000381 [Paenibacillus melissococcoides]|uniref:Orc1-like AAA ATPase domain-containing protein n=1 Tax=Paenibacillus melissococcoides TaxID=2912268 RepID=A0ABM9FVH4_9BACL|nr:hypothetical protein [Paenibacillus melissococcoides]MEB9894774.1 hypothetical protein [Bacillus cereus]CAH8243154.1 hypothetical protein WJ0W_000381 [Paenibacillus melissococcoides]CAH8703859.1 hypothetical protein WDD9_000374 [Paenibacillus melissococcoides]CAH8706942.1 hypothetical protein HTL2_001458 [Paenibacillus melissococcoides]
MLTSGPGFGKTTALSAFLRSSDLTYAWYGVSPQDNDFIPFVSHIVYTLRQAVPGFGETVLGDMKGGSRSGSEDIYALADLFLNELTMLPQQTLLIIDDYHLVEATDSIEQWMQYVLAYLPDCEKLRIVISSRSRPQWDRLASMRIRGHLLELAREDLAFNEEEIDVLFSDYYDYPLSSSEVRRIFEQTEGWIIVVQLIWQRLLSSNGTDAWNSSAPLWRGCRSAASTSILTCLCCRAIFSATNVNMRLPASSIGWPSTEPEAQATGWCSCWLSKGRRCCFWTRFAQDWRSPCLSGPLRWPKRCTDITRR